MTNFTFNCSNNACNQPIPAHVQQGGMKIVCPHCGDSSLIPTLGIPAPQPSALATPKTKTPTLTDHARDVGKTILQEQIGFPLFSGSVDVKSQSHPETKPPSPSLIDRLYTKAGTLIDHQLAGEVAEGSVKEKLQIARAKYLTFSPYRRRHIAFFISLLLVFMLVSVFTMSLYSGLGITLIYASFVALNQVKVLNRIFSTITDIIVAFTVFFLPEALKDIISSVFKYIVYFFIVISLGVYIAPAYIAYKAFLIYSDKTEV